MTFSIQVKTLIWSHIFNMTFKIYMPFLKPNDFIRRVSKRETRCEQSEWCAFLKLRLKTSFVKTAILVYSLETKPLIFREIWDLISESTLKELSNAHFRGAENLLVLSNGQACQKMLKKQNLTFDDL